MSGIKYKLFCCLLICLCFFGCSEMKSEPTQEPTNTLQIGQSSGPDWEGQLGGHDWDDFEPAVEMKRLLKGRIIRWLSGELKEEELYKPDNAGEESAVGFSYEEAIKSVPNGTVEVNEDIIGGWVKPGVRKYTAYAKVTADSGQEATYKILIYDTTVVGSQLIQLYNFEKVED